MMKEVVLAVFCGLAFAMATPVLPERDLGEIDPIDSCLFLCNICFNEDVSSCILWLSTMYRTH